MVPVNDTLSTSCPIYPPSISTCSGHGTCYANNGCLCDSGWTGTNDLINTITIDCDIHKITVTILWIISTLLMLVTFSINLWHFVGPYYHQFKLNKLQTVAPNSPLLASKASNNNNNIQSNSKCLPRLTPVLVYRISWFLVCIFMFPQSIIRFMHPSEVGYVLCTNLSLTVLYIVQLFFFWVCTTVHLYVYIAVAFEAIGEATRKLHQNQRTLRIVVLLLFTAAAGRTVASFLLLLPFVLLDQTGNYFEIGTYKQNRDNLDTLNAISITFAATGFSISILCFYMSRKYARQVVTLLKGSLIQFSGDLANPTLESNKAVKQLERLCYQTESILTSSERRVFIFAIQELLIFSWQWLRIKDAYGIPVSWSIAYLSVAYNMIHLQRTHDNYDNTQNQNDSKTASYSTNSEFESMSKTSQNGYESARYISPQKTNNALNNNLKTTPIVSIHMNRSGATTPIHAEEDSYVPPRRDPIFDSPRVD